MTNEMENPYYNLYYLLIDQTFEIIGSAEYFKRLNSDPLHPPIPIRHSINLNSLVRLREQKIK
jgi:hypothetical protein